MAYDPGKVVGGVNGLNVVNRNVELGGPLTKDTTITGAGRKMELLSLSDYKVTATGEAAIEANSFRLKLLNAASHVGKWLKITGANGEVEPETIPEGHPAVSATFDALQPNSFDSVTQTLNINPDGLKGVTGVDLDGSNVLTISLVDGTTVTKDLSVLAVDKFLANATWDAVNRQIVLEVNDGNGGTLAPINVPLADLVPVESDGVTVTGDGTSASKLKAGKLEDIGGGSYRWTAADGVSTFDITLPTFAGAENGIVEEVSGKVALGGSLIKDTLIDAANFVFGVIEASIARLEAATTTISATTLLKIATPAINAVVKTAKNGWALVLTDEDTGAVEFRRPIQTSKSVSVLGGSGSVNIDADTGFVYVNTSGGPATCQLPDGGATRMTITFIKETLDAQPVILLPNSGSTVGGASSFTFADYDLTASGLGQHASQSATWNPATSTWAVI